MRTTAHLFAQCAKNGHYQACVFLSSYTYKPEHTGTKLIKDRLGVYDFWKYPIFIPPCTLQKNTKKFASASLQNMTYSQDA